MTLPAANDTRPVVAHILPWSGLGGVEVATLRLIAATQDRFRHVPFLLEDAADVRREFDALGIPVRTYVPPTPSVRHGLRYYRESHAVAQLLQDERVQIVHFSDMKAAEHNSLAALLAGCRQICHVRVSMPEVSLRNRLSYLPVQLFLFVSREAQQSFGSPRARQRSRVVYDAVEMPEPVAAEIPAQVRQELGIQEGRPVVGTVARVSAQKDYRTLALAAVEVLAQRPDTLFLIVGDNSRVELNRRHFEEIEAELKRLGVRESFLFTGHRSDVKRLITAMDFCVLSTHREGFPLSILETMAMGKAVIATSVGGIPEIVQPAQNGYLVPHQDSSALAASILQLIQHPDEAIQMGMRAAETVRRDYSPQRFADEMAGIYQGMLPQRGRL
jgi:glycosyltransferase involved in cell wall biosynthesis